MRMPFKMKLEVRVRDARRVYRTTRARILIGAPDPAARDYDRHEPSLTPRIHRRGGAQLPPGHVMSAAHAYELQLDRVDGRIFDRICRAAATRGVVLVVEQAWVGEVLVRYLHDWAARTEGVERRLKKAWQRSRDAAKVAFNVRDPGAAGPKCGCGDNGCS